MKKIFNFLNPNLKNLSKKQVGVISLDSLINRKIKEIELAKFFDLTKKMNWEVNILKTLQQIQISKI